MKARHILALLLAAVLLSASLARAGGAAAQTSELARATALNQQAVQLHDQGRYAEAEPL